MQFPEVLSCMVSGQSLPSVKEPAIQSYVIKISSALAYHDVILLDWNWSHLQCEGSKSPGFTVTLYSRGDIGNHNATTAQF